MANNTLLTPLPTLGEVVRFIIDAFGFNEGLIEISEEQECPEQDQCEEMGLEECMEYKTRKASERFREKLDNFALEHDFDLEKANTFIYQSIGKYIRVIFKDEETVNEILSLVDAFIHSYKDLVLNIKVKFSSREDIFKEIMMYFITYIAHLAFYLETTGKISLIQTPGKKFWYLVTRDTDDISYPVANVINWWMDVNKIDSIKDFARTLSKVVFREEINKYYDQYIENGHSEDKAKQFSEDQISDKIENYYDNVLRWMNGQNNPIAASIIKLLDPENPLSKSLVLNLLIARASQHVYNEFVKLFNEKLQSNYREVKNGEEMYLDYLVNSFHTTYKRYKENFNFGKLDEYYHKRLLYLAETKNEFQRAINNKQHPNPQISRGYNSAFSRLNILTSLKRKKYKSSLTEATQLIEAFKKITPIEKDYRYYFLWKEARINVLTGKFQDAADLYIKAFEEGRYKAGKDLCEIIREGYCLVCFLDQSDLGDNRKDIMQRMHKWGELYELFQESYSESHVSKNQHESSWLSLLQKQQFFKIFPLDSFYPECDEDIIRELKVKEEMIYKYNMDNIKRDLTEWYEEEVAEKTSDRVKYSGYPYIKYNQLSRFAITGQLEKLKSACKGMVNVNTTNNDNATALYYAIKEGNLEVAQFLLTKMKSKSIKEVTLRDKMPALGEFVNLVATKKIKDRELYLDILKKFLDRGCNVNQRYSLEGYYPLYGYIRLLDADIEFTTNFDNIEDISLDTKHASRSNYLRVTTSYIFAKELYENDISKTHDLEFYEKRCNNALEYNNELIREAIEILLKHEDTDINKKSFRSYTPLLMSAQLGEYELFKLLVKKGADIYAQSAGGGNVLLLSLENNNYRIADFVLDNCQVDKMVAMSSSLEVHIINLIDRLFVPQMNEVNLSDNDKKLIKTILLKLSPVSGRAFYYSHMSTFEPYWEKYVQDNGFITEDGKFDFHRLYPIIDRYYVNKFGNKIDCITSTFLNKHLAKI